MENFSHNANISIMDGSFPWGRVYFQRKHLRELRFWNLIWKNFIFLKFLCKGEFPWRQRRRAWVQNARGISGKIFAPQEVSETTSATHPFLPLPPFFLTLPHIHFIGLWANRWFCHNILECLKRISPRYLRSFDGLFLQLKIFVARNMPTW